MKRELGLAGGTVQQVMDGMDGWFWDYCRLQVLLFGFWFGFLLFEQEAEGWAWCVVEFNLSNAAAVLLYVCSRTDVHTKKYIVEVLPIVPANYYWCELSQNDYFSLRGHNVGLHNNTYHQPGRT